jgi:hypothetical protein
MSTAGFGKAAAHHQTRQWPSHRLSERTYTAEKPELCQMAVSPY